MRTKRRGDEQHGSGTTGRKSTTRARTVPSADDSSDVAIRLTLTLAVVVAFLASRLGPSNWLWGMNILRYYSSAIGLLFLGLSVAAIWWIRPLEDSSRIARGLSRARPLPAAFLAAAAALALFILFRSRSFLLGDGMELIRRIHQGDVPAPRAPLFNLLQPIFFRWFEQDQSAGSGESAAAISFLAGFLAVAAVVFHLVRVAHRRPAAALTALVFLLTTGGLQLFFGYVEVYALLATGTLIFVAASFDRLTGGGRGALAGATIGLATALVAHPFGTTLLPAWLYLVTGRPEGEAWRLSRRALFMITGAAAGLVMVLVLLFALHPEWEARGVSLRYLSPKVQFDGLLRGLAGINKPVSWNSEYTVFSIRHAADCWNTAWLSGAAALAFLAGALLLPAGRAAFRSPPVVLPLLAFVMITLYRVLWRTPLGALRDWDLYAGLGFGLAAIAAGLALAGVGRRLAGPALAAGLYFLVPWVGIQVDVDRAARRHFDGADAEPRPEPMIAAQFHGVMGDRFSSIRDFEMAARAYEKALQLRPRHEYAWRLGMTHFAARRFEQAIPPLEQALELRPDDRTTLLALAEVNVDAGHADAADRWIDRALALFPDSGAAWLQRGRNAARRGHPEEALRAFNRADSLFKPNDPARADLVRARATVTSAPSSPR